LPTALVSLASAAFAPSTLAVEVVAAAQHTSEYTTNTLRTENNHIGEWIHQPGVDFRASEDTAQLEMDVDYSYIRRIYTRDIWENEDRLVGRAAIDWHAVTNRLDFFLNNIRTESTERALRASTQANRQIVSTTDVGSRLRFQPRSADELQLEYLFRDIHTTRTATDSQRHNVTGRYMLGVSENRNFTLLATYSDIEYEGPFPEAEYVIAGIGYAQTTNRMEFDLNVGYNWYERTGRGSTSEPAYYGSLTWQATPDIDVGLDASHRITDQSNALADGTTGGAENTNVNAAFEETSGLAFYRHQLGSATSLELSSSWARQNYADDVPLSNTRIGARVSFDRSLTPTAKLNLYGDLSNRDFEDQLDDQDEYRAGFKVNHRLGRTLNFDWGVRYERREATSTRSYEEWIGSLQIHWMFWGASR
jgi:hypothetical protein